MEDRSEGRLAKRIFQSEGKASKSGVRKGLTFAKNKEPRVITCDCRRPEHMQIQTVTRAQRAAKGFKETETLCFMFSGIHLAPS